MKERLEKLSIEGYCPVQNIDRYKIIVTYAVRGNFKSPNSYKCEYAENNGCIRYGKTDYENKGIECPIFRNNT